MTEPVENPFTVELEQLLNRHSQENGSDTPDFVLSRFLVDCLHGLDTAVRRRERWYGRLSGDGLARTYVDELPPPGTPAPARPEPVAYLKHDGTPSAMAALRSLPYPCVEMPRPDSPIPTLELMTPHGHVLVHPHDTILIYPDHHVKATPRAQLAVMHRLLIQHDGCEHSWMALLALPYPVHAEAVAPDGTRAVTIEAPSGLVRVQPMDWVEALPSGVVRVYDPHPGGEAA